MNAFAVCCYLTCGIKNMVLISGEGLQIGTTKHLVIFGLQKLPGSATPFSR